MRALGLDHQKNHTYAEPQTNDFPGPFAVRIGASVDVMQII
jgi:hypothetical protein